jgi:hypothetical protein
MRKNDTHSSNTCNMYMSDLRYIHDPVLSSLKMEGIRLLFCKLQYPWLSRPTTFGLQRRLESHRVRKYV